jgi:hypothetical protein
MKKYTVYIKMLMTDLFERKPVISIDLNYK